MKKINVRAMLFVARVVFIGLIFPASRPLSQNATSSQLKIFRKWNEAFCSIPFVRESLEKKLSGFLRKRRGDLTYTEFSKKLGLTPSTLHRLEQCQQSITLRTLQQIMGRLKCSLIDIFSEDK